MSIDILKIKGYFENKRKYVSFELSIILDEGGDGDDQRSEGDGVVVPQGQHDSRARVKTQI